ncbi:MAG TPA: PAS domain-containing protein, partial [Chitinophagales bacterium]|nr:PAS domain-containing protein [Chitinophagales bacterium]
MKKSVKSKNEKKDLVFSELPAFASFIKENGLDDFVEEQLTLSKELKLPMLAHFKLSDKELKTASLQSSTELLVCFMENRASERIVEAQMRWVENKMGLLRQDQVTTEDIAYLCFIQKQAFLKMLPKYTTVASDTLKIIKELDRYYMQVERASTNTYVEILKKHLGQQEKQLLEAQALAHIGNWVWDIENQKLKWTDELFRIYGLEPRTEISNKEIREFNHPDDDGFIRQQLQLDEANPDHTNSDFVYRIILKDGTIK